MYLIQKHLNVLSIILLILGGLLFSGVLVAGASDRAEDPAPTEESASSDDEVDIQVTEDYCNAYKFNRAAMTEEIFEQAGINVDFTFANVFGGTQKKPKVEDLYLSIYQELKEAPSDTALEETAEANQMTQTELCSILGGNYQLLSTIYSENYSNDDLLEVVEGLQEQYDTVLENEAFKKDLFWETYPQEIFVNGDTEDSGFDVLYDLEIIEYILFGEDSTIGSGGSFGMGDWGDEDEEEEAEDEELDIEPEEPDAEPEDEDSEPTEDEEEGEEESEETAAIDPSECIADSDLQSAFESAVPEDEEDEDDGDEDSGDGGDGDDDSGSGGGDDDDDDGDDGGITIASDQTENWTTPKLCNAVFCLVIRMVNKDDPTYETSSNCVKCHVDYIIKALEETNSVGLNPGKLSGNLFEPAMCKRSAINNRRISLNFIPIAMPIRTPPPDDIVTGTNPWDSFKDFVQDTWDIDQSDQFALDEEAAETVEYDRDGSNLTDFSTDIYEDAVKQEANMSGSTISNEELFSNAMASYEETLAEINDKFDNAVNYSRASGSQNFYQSLQTELNQMVFYFSSYRTLIGLTQEVANDLKNSLQKVS